MKRLIIILTIIAILGILSPTLSTLTQFTQATHENPATATGSLDKVALLLSYYSIYNLATDRQYQDAREMLAELRHANIPSELRYLTDRYLHLSQQLLNTLDNLESLIDEAAILLSHNQTSEAKQRLDDATAALSEAQLLIEDIEMATDAMSDKLGVLATPAMSRIREAHIRLEGMLYWLNQLTIELEQLLESPAEIYRQQVSELIPTNLSLSISPASVYIGDSLTASGRLTVAGQALAEKKLSLTLDDESLSITTNSDGSYTTSLTIPYKYVPNMTLTAVYEPSGDDTGKYQASQSPPEVINTMFYPTLLELSAPETAHPGLPTTVSGRVSSTDGNIERTIKILLDDTRLAEETVPGQFSLEVTPPEETSIGKHDLTVVVTPQGRYTGASKSQTVNVSQLPIYINTQMPDMIIIPETIQISGTVYHEFGPVAGTTVSLGFKDSAATARTAADGSFSASLDAPLDLSLIGPQEVRLTVEPAAAAYTLLQTKRQLFTINPLNTGLILIVLITLGLLAYRRSKAGLREEKVLLPAQVRELPAITPLPELKPTLTGIKGRILSAYRSGLEAVENIVGISMAPNTTLREFLETATSQSPTAIKPFADLTTMAEDALYSTHHTYEDKASRAEQLATAIKEELHSGTS